MYPVVKLVFDASERVALWVLVGVLFVFSVGKDILALLVQMVDTLTHHQLSSVMAGLGEFSLFGSYGYVLLYFVVGGVIARWLSLEGATDGFPRFRAAAGCIAACFAVTFLIQRYQHHVDGAELVVQNGYWLLPTFAATVLLVMVMVTWNTSCRGLRRGIESIGNNTFGIYMLHMFALMVFARLQGFDFFEPIARLGGTMLTLVNIIFVAVIFVVCWGLSVAMRMIPMVGRLFAL